MLLLIVHFVFVFGCYGCFIAVIILLEKGSLKSIRRVAICGLFLYTMGMLVRYTHEQEKKGFMFDTTKHEWAQKK